MTYMSYNFCTYNACGCRLYHNDLPMLLSSIWAIVQMCFGVENCWMTFTCIPQWFGTPVMHLPPLSCGTSASCLSQSSAVIFVGTCEMFMRHSDKQRSNFGDIWLWLWQPWLVKPCENVSFFVKASDWITAMLHRSQAIATSLISRGTDQLLNHIQAMMTIRTAEWVSAFF